MAKKTDTNKDYAIALYRMTLDKSGAELKEVTRAFVHLLAVRGLLKHADRIINEFINYSKQENDEKEIEITSAHSLSENVVKTIKQAFGRNVTASTKVDASILGGIVVKTTDKIFDASLKTQVERLHAELS